MKNKSEDEWTTTAIDRNLYGNASLTDDRNNNIFCSDIPMNIKISNEGGNKFLEVYFRAGYSFTLYISDEIYDSLSNHVSI